MIKKYEYRIKTKDEFLNEFGIHWRDRVNCSFVSSMDLLLGKKLDVEYTKKIEDMFNGLTDYIHYTCYDFGCNISLDMIKRVNLSPSYNPKKFVY